MILPKMIKKSRTYAVILLAGGQLGAYFLCAKTEIEDDRSNTFLDIASQRFEKWGLEDLDQVIKLLVTAGLTVRYFDYEERQWMDQSAMYGVVRAPGPRDGNWGPPTTVEDFQRDYLNSL